MPELPITYWFDRQGSNKKSSRNHQPRVKRKQIEDTDDDWVEDGPPPKKSGKGKKGLSSTKSRPSEAKGSRAASNSRDVATPRTTEKYPTPKSLLRTKNQDTMTPLTDGDLIDLTEDNISSDSPSTSRQPEPRPLPPTPSSPHHLASPSFHTPRRHRKVIAKDDTIVPETSEGSPVKGTPAKRLPPTLEDVSQIPTSQSQDVDACWSPTKRRAPGERPSINPIQSVSSSQSVVPSSQSQDILCEATPKRGRRLPPLVGKEDTGPNDVTISQSQTETDYSFPYRFGALVNNDDVVPTSQPQSEIDILDTTFVSPRPTSPPSSSLNTPRAVSLPNQNSTSSQPLDRFDSNASFIVPIEDVDISNLFEEGDLVPIINDQPPTNPSVSAKPPSQSVTESDSDGWRPPIRPITTAVRTRPPVPAQTKSQSQSQTQSQTQSVTPSLPHSSHLARSLSNQTQPDCEMEPESVPPTQDTGDLAFAPMVQESVSSFYTLPQEAKDFLEMFD